MVNLQGNYIVSHNDHNSHLSHIINNCPPPPSSLSSSTCTMALLCSIPSYNLNNNILSSHPSSVYYLNVTILLLNTHSSTSQTDLSLATLGSSKTRVFPQLLFSKRLCLLWFLLSYVYQLLSLISSNNLYTASPPHTKCLQSCKLHKGLIRCGSI